MKFLTHYRFCTLVLLVLTACGAAPLMAQHQARINANPRWSSDQPILLTDALNELKAHYGVAFFYNPDDVEHKLATPTHFKNSLEGNLQQLLNPLGFTFQPVDQKVYVIKPSMPKKRHRKQLDDPMLLSGTLSQGTVPVMSHAAPTFSGLPTRMIALKINRIVRGQVTDEASGEGLPGVSVVVKGTNIGTSTDVNGQFELSIPDDARVLSFSFIGYASKEVLIGTQSKLNVSLSSGLQRLDEVVVVGYGEQQRKDVTGSISSIKGQELKSLPVAGIDQMIQGRASGVTVTNNSGQPGGGVSVRIRGITSLTGSNEPLYVIDGVPVQGDGVQSQAFHIFGGGGGQTAQSALASINPNDILSIDILKDASAAAIYGARASNGVVMITTRRGKANDSRVGYDVYFGSQEVQRRLDVMGLQDYAKFVNQVDKEYGRQPTAEFADPTLLGKGTDWQSQVFQRAPMMSHQLSVSGGKDRTQFYIAAGYFEQEGIVVGSNFNRASFRINLDNQAKSWLKLGSSLNIMRTNQRVTLNDDDQGVVSAALLQSPDVPVRYTDGSWGGPLVSTFGFQTNPVALALLKDVKRLQNRALGNLYADVTLLKGLSLRVEAGGDFSIGNNSAFNPTYRWGAVVNEQNKYARSDNQNVFWVVKEYLTYNKNFGEKHRLNFLLGHEANKSSWEWLGGTRTGFFSNTIQALNAGTATTATNENGKGAATLESFFARANYNFGDRYGITLTVRRDGSSNVGRDNPWGTFPSAAFAWTVSNEKFLENNKTISNLKLRLGYGAVGNQNIPAYSYGAALNPLISEFGTAFYLNQIPNSQLRWESAAQANAGLDVGVFKNRIVLALDVYDKISYDFLYQLPLPAYTGAGSNWDDTKSPFVNLGRMENRGIDLTLTTENISRKNFSWRTTLVMSHYRNKLLELSDESAAIFRNVQWFNTVTKSAVGQPVGQFYGYRTDGIFQSVEEVNAHAQQSEKVDRNSGTWTGDIRFKNLNDTPVNGKQVIDGQDREYIGSPHPDFTYGFTNAFTIGNFDLSVFVQGSQGAEIFNFTRRYTEGMNSLSQNQLMTVNNRWTSENPGSTMPRLSLGDPNLNNRVSDRFIEDGSYLRLQNVSFGYALPAALLQRIKMQRLRVYGSIQNLYTFTKYTGFDPELGSYNQDALLMNVDNGHYPNPRTYTLGLNVEF
jgi:TonB-dependent starch-binding outer membrane protein SusC